VNYRRCNHQNPRKEFLGSHLDRLYRAGKIYLLFTKTATIRMITTAETPIVSINWSRGAVTSLDVSVVVVDDSVVVVVVVDDSVVVVVSSMYHGASDLSGMVIG